MSSKRPIASTEPITGQTVEIIFGERTEPSHEGVKEIVAYWNTCRQAGEFVMGRDVPARPIARLTKHLVVLEPIDAGADFLYRLVGSILNDRIGRDITGMLVTDVYAEVAAKSYMAALNRTIANDAPVFLESRARGLLDDLRRAEAVALPMKSPDGRAVWVLNCVFYL
jgi:hypothetical protein